MSGIPEHFQRAISEFEHVHQAKQELKKNSEPLNKKQKELNERILKFMIENELDSFDLGNGQVLLLKDTKKTPTLSPEMLTEIIKGHSIFAGKSPQAMNEFVTFVYDSRPVEHGKTVRRQKKKESKA